eukprot:gnl/MRDRNA2_/MRDRNA2_122472_c0_seq1.p1 gnl/MRDRNA2_/MRDRNA2_122472_c0~~gnl/MRDRNA2_/MRDRNA2_122472_c0_seq1.p1  ORF type:complete len:550 (+),score=98.95 gnl/MRDRNA2_/MRDRNA2_122472_c0_seq1:120-1769(+)
MAMLAMMAGGDPNAGPPEFYAAPLDPELQRKYDAMGLPDPNAFACLTALGAIKDPMKMLNSMMKAAEQKQKEMELMGTQAPPPLPMDHAPPHMGGNQNESFVDAFKALQETNPPLPPMGGGPKPMPPASGYGAIASQRGRRDDDNPLMGAPPVPTDLPPAEPPRRMDPGIVPQTAENAAEHAKEQLAMRVKLAEEARAAAAKLRDKLANADSVRSGHRGGDDNYEAANRGAQAVALAFRDEDEVAGKGPLRHFIDGSDRGGDNDPEGKKGDKLYLGGLPRGVGEADIRAECTKYGAIAGVIRDVNGTSAWITFHMPEMAHNALRHISGRRGIFGASEPLEVKVTDYVPTNIQLQQELPSALDSRDVQYSMQQQNKRKHDRRSRSRRRRRRRSDSSSSAKSHTQSGQYIPAHLRKKQAPKREERRRDRRRRSRSRSKSHTNSGQYIRATGCSSSIRWWSRSRSPESSSDEDSKRPRQVAVKGNWAQFVQNGTSYYYNVITGQTTWERPNDFEVAPSRRLWESVPPGAKPQGWQPTDGQPKAAAPVAGVFL